MTTIEICGMTFEVSNGRAFSIVSNTNRSDEDDAKLGAALDGIESLVLAIGSRNLSLFLDHTFKEAVQASLDAVGNYYGDCDDEDK